jgi:tRNA/rRNA methyltransferase
LRDGSEFDRLRVVLVATRNPLNIGAAARAMSNFGCADLRLVNPYQAAFREARSAVGAGQLLAKAEVFKSLAEAVADCTLVVGTTAVRRRELQHPLRLLPDGARVILRYLIGRRVASGRLASGRVALLFGSEKTGLSNQALSHCHWLMRIPTSEQNISMNLGQAVAVCLYELARSGNTALHASATGNTDRMARANADEVERLTALLLGVLRSSGYLKPRASGATEEKVRRLVRRLGLTASDAEIWLGMMRQIGWKLGAEEKS